MRSKLLILSLLFCLHLSGQIANNEAFSFSDVVTELSGIGKQPQIDRVTRNSTPGDVYIGCNNYVELMTWEGSAIASITNFVSLYHASYGDVTLSDNSNGTFDFTGLDGIPFTAAYLNPTYGSAETIQEALSESSDLINCFSRATTEDFDSRYYAYYLVAGGNLLATNSLLNFRNYGGTPDGIPIPVATAATDIGWYIFTSNWDPSVGGTSYRLDVSIESDFSSYVPGYEDLNVGTGTISESYAYTVASPSSSETYYYRFRAVTPNGTSGNSNTINLTTDGFESDYHDWTLASRDDLQWIETTLYDYGVGNLSGTYWSDETYVPNTLYAYGRLMGFSEGHFLKVNDHKVRAVRTFVDTELHPPRTFMEWGIVFYGYDAGGGDYVNYVCTMVDVTPAATWADAITICDGI